MSTSNREQSLRRAEDSFQNSLNAAKYFKKVGNISKMEKCHKQMERQEILIKRRQNKLDSMS